MKTKTILFLFLLISGIMSAQVKRVAILETVDRENKVSYGNKLILRANLSKAITNTAGYEAYDRTDIDAIMGEQNFQRTGLVSNDQIKKLGEMTGADYILVAEAAVVDANNMFITAKLLDVETARTIMTDNVMMAANPEAIQEGCVTLAKQLFNDTKPETKDTQDTQDTSNLSVLEPIPVATDMLVRNSKSTQKQLGIKEWSYGNTEMDKKSLLLFLKKNDALVYKQFSNSQALIKSGWWTFGCGMGLIGISFGVLVFNEDIASIGMTIGMIPLAASIPLLSVGYVRQKKAIQLFNGQNVAESELSLNLQTSHNGIGLALNF